MSNTNTEPSIEDLMTSLMHKIEQYEMNEAHINAPCGDEPVSPVEPTPAQLARERVLHDFESAFAMLTGGR